MANSGHMAGATCPKPSSPPLMNWNAPSARCARSGLLAVLPRHAGRLRGPAQPVVSGRGHFRRAGRGAHLPEARGPEPHRRPQDQQLPGPDPAGAPHGRAASSPRPARASMAWPPRRCALYGLQCVVYMGAQDMARQSVNVRRMRMLGAQVRAVHTGTATLKDAMNEAARLDRQRRRHLLSAGHRRGPIPIPGWCASSSA